jgi:ABC-type nitrate/sulfonate/bicarbonate transport system ATPase subunit
MLKLVLEEWRMASKHHNTCSVKGPSGKGKWTQLSLENGKDSLLISSLENS